jgi:hypothetical protein
VTGIRSLRRLGISLAAVGSTSYKGYLADCLNCWGNVADVLARVSKNSYQLPLLGELSYVVN